MKKALSMLPLGSMSPSVLKAIGKCMGETAGRRWVYLPLTLTGKPKGWTLSAE